MSDQELYRRVASTGPRVEVAAATLPWYASRHEAQLREGLVENAQHLLLRFRPGRGGFRERETSQKFCQRMLVFAKIAQYLLLRCLHGNGCYRMKSAGNGNELLSRTRAWRPGLR